MCDVPPLPSANTLLHSVFYFNLCGVDITWRENSVVEKEREEERQQEERV